MKKLKKILICLVLAVTLGLSFTACDNAITNENPEEKEVYKTESITYAEFQNVLSEMNVTMASGFKAEHKTTYEDGSSDTAEQFVSISDGEIKSSLEVTGNKDFKGYLFEQNVYYEDADSKLFSFKADANNHPSYKTTTAYNYMMHIINPINIEMQDCHIYDGSLFDKLLDLFAASEEEFIFNKIYSTKHTNIEIEFSDAFNHVKFTLYFEGKTFTGLDMWIKTDDYERTTSVKAAEVYIKFPSFDDFVVENSDESVDDTWSPNS